MTCEQFIKECLNIGIPLADIKVIFDGYFKIPFDHVLINQNQELNFNTYDLLNKLKQGYPANYLAGYIDILHLHILLNESTLIPRNETEQFVYYLVNNYDLNNKKILDLCTGSGFIAIAIKHYFKDSIVTASDISNSALEIAKKSAEINNTTISFIQSDYFKSIDDTFDYIISNPPYIEEDNKEVNAPFEPKIALFSGKDGLDSYREIFKNLKSHLSKNGEAFFEMESTNSTNTIKLFTTICKEFNYTIWKDDYNRDRYLKCSFK